MSLPMKYADERTAAFRATLDRLPDEIALAIGLHLFDEDTLQSGFTCVCGWAAREAIARSIGVAPESEATREAIFTVNVPSECALRFGGSASEWDAIYWGVATSHGDAPLIEEALFDRVMAAAENTSPVSRPSSLRRPRQHKKGK